MTVTVDCTVPQAAGTMLLTTKDPNNPSVSHELSCTAGAIPSVVQVPTTGRLAQIVLLSLLIKLAIRVLRR